jgi:uncharacterized membrane protein
LDRLTKAFIALAAVGVGIALYHAYGEITYFQGNLSNICNVFSNYSRWLSCTTVFASGYATIPWHDAHGFPLYVFGVVWFPLLIALGVWSWRKYGALNGEVLVPMVMVGNIFTFYLWYLELGLIHAICPVCVSMYIVNYAMTGLAFKALLQPKGAGLA